MKLIVGLGNPDKKYDNTRHNVGFMVIDNYLGDVTYKEKFNSLYYETIINKEKVIFLKPQTYMNNSGESVSEFVKYYDIDNQDILVIQDDLDLEIGTIKFKINSSSGGHNGIKSIINYLHGDNFFRMKIGINNEYRYDTIDFVLGKMSKEELSKIDFNITKSAIDDFIKNDYNYVMNKYNGKKDNV